MPEQITTVDHWLGLSHPDLAEHVRQAVRGGAANPVWAAVAGHPVLAARVRGLLSALLSQMADHRDHAMWTVWINSARRALASAPAVEPAVEQPKARPSQAKAAFTAPDITIDIAPAPRAARNDVAPVTFLAPGQAPA